MGTHSTSNVYHLSGEEVNEVKDARDAFDIKGLPISGNYLAHNRHDPIGKALTIAAPLYLGIRVLGKPTLGQAAMLARCNRTYAFWAVKRYEQREDILAGLLPLVPPNAPKPFSSVSETITDAELAEVIRKAGIARMLDVAAMFEAAE
jgi:hypothetical protein